MDGRKVGALPLNTGMCVLRHIGVGCYLVRKAELGPGVLFEKSAQSCEPIRLSRGWPELLLMDFHDE